MKAGVLMIHTSKATINLSHENYFPFTEARPVWLEGFSGQKNITAGLYTAVSGSNATLKVATSGYFRVFINGIFVHYGPARCAHGFFRVDEVSLHLTQGVNHIAIDAVCYGVNSFSTPLQDPFITAELCVDGTVCAATGAKGFDTYHLTERIQKVQRYSYQRPFAESYRLNPGVNDWRTGAPAKNAVISSCEILTDKNYVPRRLNVPCFPKVSAAHLESTGTFKSGVKPEKYRKDRSLTEVADAHTGAVDGFVENELELHLSDEACEMLTTSLIPAGKPYTGTSVLSAGEFEILSLPCEKTGLIGLEIECTQAGILYLMVDETLRTTGDVDPLSMDCVNINRMEMTPGSLRMLMMEPLSFKYIKIACSTGAFTVTDLHVREVICPQPVTAACASSDKQMQKIFDAARETFLQNSFDIFMDCPSRERAGWLCDSFFTGRSEYFFTGANAVERNFLENFLLAESFPVIADGMLPMCYPSDHYNGDFIPNWAMWMVLELREYRIRSGDLDLIEAFRPRIEKLLKFFEQYENKDGLLEKLPRWVFVEWSHANDLVQDINFPSNMLYAAMLDAAADLYGNASLHDKAERLREVIRLRSFNGAFFTDNEVYLDGQPVSSGEITETCQYYAFFTDTATPQSHPELWETLIRDFGPERAERGLWPEIWPSNAFIGNYLRLDLLRRYKKYAQILRESVGYFLYMADKTGTLWENTTDFASCNHGFASYAAVLLDEAIRAER